MYIFFHVPLKSLRNANVIVYHFKCIKIDLMWLVLPPLTWCVDEYLVNNECPTTWENWIFANLLHLIARIREETEFSTFNEEDSISKILNMYVRKKDPTKLCLLKRKYLVNNNNNKHEFKTN